MDTQSGRRRRSEDPEHESSPHRSPTGRLSESQCTTSYSGGTVEHFVLGEPYDYTVHEALPAVPSTHPQFDEAQKLVVEVVEKISQLVPAGGFQDEELTSLFTKLQRLREVNYGKPLKVGILGDTGSGKSSFINALLEQRELAKEGDSGSSCTQIVTEYVDADPNCTSSRAAIKFKDRATIDRDIRKHFLAYLKYRPRKGNGRQPILDYGSDEHDEFNSIGDKEGEGEEEGPTNASPNEHDEVSSQVSDEDQGELDESEDDPEAGATRRECFKTAEEYIMQLFSALLEFKHPVDLENMMLPYSSQTCGGKIRRLQKTIRNEMSTMLRFGGDEHILESHDLEELAQKSRCFTMTQPTGSRAFWPIVESVTISFRSPLLRQGIAMGDCPGLSDTNLARRQAAQKYLQDCSIIIVVATIDRILDSPSVEKYLNSYIPQVGIANVMLLPTKSDLVRHNPSGRAVTRSDLNKLESLEQAMHIATRNLQHAKGVTRAQKAALRQTKMDSERVLTLARIKIRNKTVVEEARRQNRDQRGHSPRELTVIPVSSAVHAQYVFGDTEDEAPILSISEDGIASVRSVLCTMARAGRVSAMRHHIESDLQRARNRIQMAMEIALNVRIGTVLDGLAAHQVRSSGRAASYRGDISTVLQQTVLPQIEGKLTKLDGDVVTGLASLVNDWKGTFHSGPTFVALARKNGIHKPSYAEDVSDLNQEVVGLFKKYLAYLIQELHSALGTCKTAVRQHGIEAVACLQNDLAARDALQNFDLQTFWDTFDVHKADFCSSVDVFFNDFVAVVHKAAMQVVSSDHTTAFNRAMQEGYRYARAAPVTGSKRLWQRFDYLHNAIRGETGPSPLEALLEELRQEFNKLMSGQHRLLITLLQAPFVSIKQDLEVKFGANSTLTSEDRRLRDELKQSFAQISPEISTMLDQAKQCLDMAVWSASAQEAERTMPPASAEQVSQRAEEERAITPAGGEQMSEPMGEESRVQQDAMTVVSEALEETEIKDEPM